jgi:predicted nucleic acid-binding protein
MVLWTMTPVEVVSALRRLEREGSLGPDLADRAEARVDQLVEVSHLVIDIESVKSQARRLLRLHPLRAADALQLGAALEWSGGHPSGRILHTFDDRLARAARLEGFRVEG